MKRFFKRVLILLIALECVVIEGQTENQTDLDYHQEMHFVGLGTSVGKDVFASISSQAVFGCAFIGDAAVESMQWKIYEHVGCTKNIDSSAINYQFFGDLYTKFIRTNPEDCFAFYEGRFNTVNPSTHVSSIIRIDNIKPFDERNVSCGFFVRNFHESGVMTFQLKVFSLPTVYMEDNPNSTDVVAGNQTTEVCSLKNIYPAPNSDSIGLYSTKTDKELDIDRVAMEVEENSDGTFDVRKYFTFTAERMHHNDSFYCNVEMSIGNTTIIKSHNSTSPIIVEHPTTDVKLTFYPNPVRDGEEAQVRCESDGYPINNITIYQLKKLHQTSWSENESNHLQFNFVANKTMGGYYICQTNNVISKTYLNVQWSADDITIWKNGVVYVDDRVINIKQGENLTLNCTQEGNPHPLTTWDVTVDGISYIKFDDWENGIVIRNATIDDSGVYLCTSSLGLKRGTKVIVGTCKPQITITGKKLVNGSVTLNVTCSKEENYPTCGLKLGTEYDNVTESVQIIETSSISKIYHLGETEENKHFWCKASTSKGFDFYTVYKSVDVKPITILNGDIIVVIGVILAGCSLIGLISFLIHLFCSCSCHKLRRPGSTVSQVEQPIIEEIDLEPMNQTLQLESMEVGSTA